MAVRAQRQTVVAQTEVRQRQAANEFVTSILESIDMRRAVVGAQEPPREVRVSDVLMDMAAQFADGYEGQPDVEASLRLTVARGLYTLGMNDEGLEQRRIALALRESFLGETHRDTIQAMILYAANLGLAGQVEECDRMSAAALSLVRSHHPHDAELLVQALNRMMNTMYYADEFDESAEYATEAMNVSRDQLALTNPERQAAANNLAHLRLKQGKPGEAEALFREVVAARTVDVGEQARATLGAKDNLTNALRALRRSDEAAALEREVLEGYIALFGEDSSQVDWVRNKLAMLLADIGEYDEAIAHAEISLDWRQSAWGDVDNRTTTALGNLVMILQRAGEFERAEPLARRALDLFEAEHGPKHQFTTVKRLALARILLGKGDPQSAEPYFADATSRLSEHLGTDHWRVLLAQSDHANCLTDLDRFDEAERMLAATEAAVTERQEALVRTRLTNAYIRLYDDWGRTDAAATWRAKLPD
jgi:tetratricopeptide (TPR) repeat protein